MKTQQVQYAEDDNHHVQPNTFSNRGVVSFGKDGAVLILQSSNNPYY